MLQHYIDLRPFGSCLVALLAVGCAATSTGTVVAAPNRVGPCEQRLRQIQCPAPTTAELQIDDAPQCAVYCVIEDQRHGPFITTTAQTVTRGAFHYGRATGEWEETTDGTVASTTQYLHGPKHGAFRVFYPSGAPKLSGAYHRDSKDGRWLEHAPDGVVLLEQNFHRGRTVGRQISRHPNGTIATEREYDGNGWPVGQWCTYDRAGAPVGACSRFVDGNGTLTEYGPNGGIVRQATFAAGVLHGLEVVYGDPRVETTWTLGKETGLRRVLTDDCVLEERMQLDGAEHGDIVRRSCTSPQVETLRGTYCGGNPCGIWVERAVDGGKVTKVTEYDHLSMKLAEATFRDGKLAGFWTMNEALKMARAACYQGIASGLCCDRSNDEYAIQPECPSDEPVTTEL